MAENVLYPHPAEKEVPVKKVKLTKKEKKLLKMRAKNELKKRLMRERLLREIGLVNKSLKLGKPLWEAICAEVKIKELRSEIEYWGKEVDRLFDKKDEKIDVLFQYLEEIQELHGRSFSKHIDQMDYLQRCLQTLRETATAVYEAQALNLVQDFLGDLSYTTDFHDNINAKAENSMFASNVVTKKRLKQNYEEYMNSKFGTVSEEVEIRYILRENTVAKMRTLQDQLLLWMTVLQGDMVDVHKTAKFLYFMDRQRNYVVESNRLNAIERASRRTITELQRELLDIEAEGNRKIYGLKLEKMYFLDVKSVIKNSIQRNKIITHEKLLADASESYEKLKEYVRCGELLLSLGVCCRKYKTEKEKILPWTVEIDPAAPNSDFRFKMDFDIAKFLSISEEELAEEMSLMKNFWYRCSNVKFHNLLLLEEKAKLNEENEKYLNVIRSLKKSDDVEYILESLIIKKVL